jgi:hypothetical protein
VTVPEPLDVGQLVRVRGQQWVVSDVSSSGLPVDELSAGTLPGSTLARLTSVSEDDLGEELSVVWEVEPGRAVIPSGALPDVPEPDRWDDPQMLGALVDAVRWGAVASADVTTLQAPFRSGIQIKEYQLEPVAKALRMPRVALLVADDVGLGKTIEAGLVIQEMLLRHRARRVLVVCPASLTLKWRDEMRDKFGLEFTLLDADALRTLRRTHGLLANPFTVYPRMIISLPWLRTPRVQRLLDEVLDSSYHHAGFFDLLVVDEAHHCAPPAPLKGRRGYAVDSQQTRAVRRLSDHPTDRRPPRVGRGATRQAGPRARREGCGGPRERDRPATRPTPARRAAARRPARDHPPPAGRFPGPHRTSSATSPRPPPLRRAHPTTGYPPEYPFPKLNVPPGVPVDRAETGTAALRPQETVDAP